MKILFAGGGSGGHFYPIIAIAREIHKIADEEGIVNVDMTFYSATLTDEERSLLREEEINYRWIPAGKIRRYWSLANFFDPLKVAIGIVKAVWGIFLDIPDVIFAKGGYSSFPALLAARIFRIPAIIHESDAIPGKVNLWASSFARRIAVSFPDSMKHFPEDDRVAFTGDPTRTSLLGGDKRTAYDIFGFTRELPVIFVTGGSQGSEKINDVFLDIVSQVVEFAEVVHQSGPANDENVKKRSAVVLENSKFPGRYKTHGFLGEPDLRDILAIANLAISRSGAGSLFMLAASGIPAILIPIKDSAQDHQRANAYSYARTGAAHVIEEENLTGGILLAEIKRILENQELAAAMSKAATDFARPDAAEKIAREIINLALEHTQ